MDIVDISHSCVAASKDGELIRLDPHQLIYDPRTAHFAFKTLNSHIEVLDMKNHIETMKKIVSRSRPSTIFDFSRSKEALSPVQVSQARDSVLPQALACVRFSLQITLINCFYDE